MSRWRVSVAVAGLAALAALASRDLWAPGPGPPDPVPAQPDRRPCPPDGPCPAPRPKPKPKPWGALGASVGGPVAPDGTEVQCDLPAVLHLKNRGGSDGSGLCVFASLTHSGRWQNEPVFSAAFEWMWAHPGGGWPEKVDQVVERIAREKGLPKPAYLQVEGSRDLDVLRAALANGLLPAVTYGKSPTGRYDGDRIAHMVTMVHCDAHWVGILDNNFPGSVEWMTPGEFLSVCNPRGYWAVLLLEPGPPPVPRNPEESTK